MKRKDTGFEWAENGSINDLSEAEQQIGHIPNTQANADDVNFKLNNLDDFANDTNNEIFNVLDEAGIVPNDLDDTQLLQAIQALGGNYADGYINGGVASGGVFNNELPLMTSSSTDGFIMSANTEFGAGFEAWRAGDRDLTSDWVGGIGILPAIHKTQLPISSIYKSLKITARDGVDFTTSPKDFTIIGSNTGAFAGEETIISTITNSTGWSANEVREFTFVANGNSYLHYGINITAVDGSTVAGFAEIEWSNSISNIIDITAVKARSSDNTQDIEVSAGSLDITSASDWASGVVPTLTSTSIYTWSDYNSGTPRFILDDATGSNISGAKRRVGALITDVSGDIVPFIAQKESSGIYYSIDSILDYDATPTATPTAQDISVPDGITLKVDLFTRGREISKTVSLQISSDINKTKRFLETNDIDASECSNSGFIYTDNASINISYISGKDTDADHQVYVQGYLDGRGV